MKIILSVLVGALLGILTQAQEEPFKYQLRGVIRDQTSAVVPSTRLRLDPGNSSHTDINGEFHAALSPGDYVLTIDDLRPETFRVFIKITENSLNPNYLELNIDTNAIKCLRDESGKDLPKIIEAAEPTVPPAARAVRAMGDVTVAVTISDDGSVSSAKALSGHPLLRAASVLAAHKFKFEPSDANPTRNARLVFMFHDDYEKPGLKRYRCPYRIPVGFPESTIDITGNARPGINLWVQVVFPTDGEWCVRSPM